MIYPRFLSGLLNFEVMENVVCLKISVSDYTEIDTALLFRKSDIKRILDEDSGLSVDVKENLQKSLVDIDALRLKISKQFVDNVS